ncbi:MAG: PEP-CTERM sorting domain-containing protein [Bryobacteraceae bacterium]|nr:PEP-CTERM sorting domain-containing protein [Bryobacteraceae bacterium]
MKVIHFLYATALTVAVATQPVCAGIITYTSNAAFQAEVAARGVALQTDSYEDLQQGFLSGPLHRSGHAVTTPGDHVFIIDNVLDATDGTKSLGASGPRRPVTYTFETPIHAFAIEAVDALSILGGDFTVQIDGGQPVTLFSGQLASRNRQFMGIIDATTPFTSLTFNATDFVDSWSFDNVQFGASAVPEPGAFVLVSAGLACIVFRRTRRQ